MRKRDICVGSMLLLAGAAAFATASVKPNETITYDFHPGGLCPSYSFRGCTPFTLTLDTSDQGTVLITNESGRKESTFQATADQARAFRRRLKPYRRHDDVRLADGSICRSSVSDGDTIDIRWSSNAYRPAHFVLNGGCLFPGHARIFAALASAPALLPIVDRIGPH
ncbi:hypothetical protein [uncultured Sphingomonas sp.]